MYRALEESLYKEDEIPSPFSLLPSGLNNNVIAYIRFYYIIPNVYIERKAKVVFYHFHTRLWGAILIKIAIVSKKELIKCLIGFYMVQI
jgi:hypothetical protein